LKGKNKKDKKIYIYFCASDGTQQQQNKGDKTVSATVADVMFTITNSAAHIIAIIEENLDINGLLISPFIHCQCVYR
jgi:hypothetical protein